MYLIYHIYHIIAMLVGHLQTPFSDMLFRLELNPKQGKARRQEAGRQWEGAGCLEALSNLRELFVKTFTLHTHFCTPHTTPFIHHAFAFLHACLPPCLTLCLLTKWWWWWAWWMDGQRQTWPRASSPRKREPAYHALPRRGLSLSHVISCMPLSSLYLGGA